MKSLKFTSVVLTLALSQAVGANALYSWKHKDGTPTFSPDPPPKGVPYVIVGPDLKPIPQPLPGLQQGNNQGTSPTNNGPINNGQVNNSQSQPVTQQPLPQPAANNQATVPAATNAAPVANAAPVKRSGDIVMTPAPGSLNNAAPQQPAANVPATAPQPDWKPVRYADDPNPRQSTSVATARTAAPEPAQADQISVECLEVKQQLLTLESKFANAVTATEMDSAIVGINSYKKAKKGLCGL